MTDLIVTNVRVHGHEGATALGVHDGRIVAIGNEQEARLAVAPSAEHVNGAGGTLTPGLVDSHCHPYLSTTQVGAYDFGEVHTWPDFLVAIRNAAREVRATHGPDGWLSAWNLDYAVFAGRPITGADFADAALGMPGYVLFFDGHTAVATPRAVELSGLTGRERFADASVVVVDDAGVPTGELLETSAFAPVVACMPAPTAQECRTAVIDTLARLNSYGVTGLVSMDGTRDRLDLYDEIDRSNGLTVRIQTALTHYQEFGEEQIADLIAQRDRHGKRWHGGLIKLFHDGVIDTGTGWLYEPDVYGDGLRPFWPDPPKYRQMVRRYAEAGFQIATHAIGDRAVGETIDTYIEVGVRSRCGAPHRVEHLETFTDQDLKRAAEAGITISMQPLHMQLRHEDHSDSWAHRLGRVRSARGWRAADVLGAGAPLVLGSDWPVAQLDARLGMAWSMLRRVPGDVDAPIFDEHLKLTGSQALDAYTRGAAEAMGQHDLGRIELGALADLVVFADDPTAVDGDTLARLPVIATIVDGDVVYRGT
ncbi:MAG: amidohydrolase [Microlunatus sp.]